jgi:hypothetical protein
LFINKLNFPQGQRHLARISVQKEQGDEGYSARFRLEILPKKVDIYSTNFGLGLAHLPAPSIFAEKFE